MIMEIDAAPKLSKYMTAPGAYNVKSFIYEINQYTRARAHTHTRARAHVSLENQTISCIEQISWQMYDP